MDDLIINKIAPLCPFLYMTLRLVCKKYSQALLPLYKKEDTKDFATLFKWYMQGVGAEEFFQGNYNIQYFFVHAIEPTWRNDFICTKTHERHPNNILIDSAHPISKYNINNMIGRKSHQDFCEYVCENICQLGCCGSTWVHFLGPKVREWAIAYDAEIRMFIIYKC